MAVLITGGTGFFGLHLARALVKRGQRVVLADVNPQAILPEDLQGKVTLADCDVSSPASYFDVVRGHEIESIYHLAVSIRTIAEENPTAAFQVNVGGVYNLLETARISGVKRVVFPSTHSAFPPGTQVVERDTRPLQYANTYGIAKIFGEQMGLYYHRRYGMDFRSMRFCAINGPCRAYIGGTSFISLLFREIVKHGRFVIPTREDTSFHNIYVKDAVRCLMELHDAREDQVKTRIYNLSGVPFTMRQLVDEIHKYLPDVQFVFQPDADLLTEIESWPHRVDDSAAREEWGWQVKYDLARWVPEFLAAESVTLESGIT